MLAALLIWTYTLVTAGLIGWACCRLVIKAARLNESWPVPFALQWLLGFAAVTTLASFLSLAIPLNLAAQVLILVLTVLAFLAWWKSQKIGPGARLAAFWRASPLAAILTLLAAGTLLLLATSKPENFDTGLYHAQAIRWIETYPAVPGLANFHSRLGFNSSWMLSQALYSFVFLGGQSFHLNTSILFLVAMLYFSSGVRNLWKGSRRFSDWARTLFFPLVFYILSSEVSSPGNDAPVTLIVWVILSEWLAYFEARRPAADFRPIILTLISVYAVTVKLSALPLVAIGLIFMVIQFSHRGWWTPLLAAGLSVLILLPWMARSVVLTGYVLYPFPAIDLFSVDWKISPQSARIEAEIIQAWARLPRQSLEQVQSMSFRVWTTEWFLNLTLNRRIILLLTLAAPFGYLVLALWQSLRRFLWGTLKTSWPIYLTAYLGLAYWFIAAPDFRFGLGFIISGLVLALTPACLYLQEKWALAARYLPRLVVGVVIVYQAFMFVSAVDPKTLAERLVQPVDYPGLPTKPCHIGQKTILVPDDISYGQCWYGVFPCSPNCNNNIEMRGPDWQDGFRPKASLPAP